MGRKITFVTLGDISSIATMKRALGMANPLHQLGWDVSIIAMDCEENRKRIQMECDRNIEIRYYRSSGVREEVESKTALVRELRPDYVYFCSFGVRNRIKKGQLKYKPTIIVEHSELLSSIKNNGFAHKVKATVMEYGSVVYADALVCASKYLVEEYQKYSRQLFKRKMPVLYSPYAYNDEVISAPKIIINELRQKYKGNKVFLYMGTMTRNYGLFTMIDAVEAVIKEHPDFRLLLMGKGRHWEEAKQYATARNLDTNIEFLGYVPEQEISSYFELADAFISPLNNTIQDIARCPSKIYMYLPFNKPVLTCKFGEPVEIFGENGFYFDNLKYESLAALISQLVKGQFIPSRIDITAHSWMQRSVDFDKWVKDFS
jgi:glycosyltransferase involved in cell wall biosynthesis